MIKISRKSLKNLPGTLWGITSFFNPAGFENKIKNYKEFRKSSKDQGLNLLAVELGFDGKSFELIQDDADILIQLQGGQNNRIWQKEALLNIALNKLPKDCDKIVWIDADIIFKNDDWVMHTTDLLEKYIVVHPFSHIHYLGPQQIDHADLDRMPSGFKEGMKIPGIAYGVASSGIKALERYPGHWGFAWAARKEVFDQIGFYDRRIDCSADLIMAYSFFGKFNGSRYLDMVFVNDESRQDALSWMQAAYKKVNTSVFYVPGTILHLWHGDLKDRNYKEQCVTLKDNHFNPSEDIKKNDKGFWQWASDKAALHKEVMNYFYLRDEDAV